MVAVAFSSTITVLLWCAPPDFRAHTATSPQPALTAVPAHRARAQAVQPGVGRVLQHRGLAGLPDPEAHDGQAVRALLPGAGLRILRRRRPPQDGHPRGAPTHHHTSTHQTGTHAISLAPSLLPAPVPAAEPPTSPRRHQDVESCVGATVIGPTTGVLSAFSQREIFSHPLLAHRRTADGLLARGALLLSAAAERCC